MNKQLIKNTIRIIVVFFITFLVLLGVIFISTFKTRGIENFLTAGFSRKKIDIIDTSNLEVNNNKYKTLDKSSWILIKNKSNNRLIFDVDFSNQTVIHGAIYYGNEIADFDEDHKKGIDIQSGKNVIDIDENRKDQFYRIDFHTNEGIEYKINSITSEPIIYSFVKDNIMKNVLFWLMVILLTIIVEIILRTSNHDLKIDLLYWIILILSINFIFAKFIVGEAYYLYRDSGQDTINQYYPYFVNEALNIKNGTFSLWNFDYGLGTCLLNLNAWTFDIFSMILVLSSVLFGIGKMHYFLVFMQIIKIIVIYILTKKYLSYFIKEKNSICLASYLSSMNGYIILWGQHYFLGTACFYIILMLNVIENVLSKKSKSGYVILAISVASLLIYSFYIGYMVLIVSAMYFLYRYFRMNDKINLKIITKDFTKCIFSVITGFLLSGIIFIPSCYNVLTASSRLSSVSANIFSRCIIAFKESFNFTNINETLSRMISNNMYLDGSVSLYYETIQVFCTIFICFFVIQFFVYEIKNASTKKDYIFCGLKIICLYFVIFNNLSGLIFNAFAYPAFRYSFILYPFLGIIIGVVWENVIIKEKISILGLTFSFVVSLYIWICSYNYLLDYKIKYVWILLSELIFGFVILYFMKFDSKHIFIYKSIFIFIIIVSTSIDHYISTNFRLVVDRNGYPLAWNKSELLGDTAEAIKWIKENDNSFYRIESNYSIFTRTGDSFIEKVSNLTYYNSTTNPNIMQFYENIYPNSLTVMNSIKYFSLKDKSDLQALYITNSKYILSKEKIDMSGIDEMHKIGEIYIYRNNNTGSVAKFFTKTIKNNEYQTSEVSKKENMLYEYAIVDDFKTKLDQNATAQFSDFYLKGQTYLRGDITCSGTGLVMISIPYQEGWDVYIDGVLVKEKYKVDYGFIGFVVQEGKHKIELKYHLPKINIGLLSSVLGIICLIIIQNNYFICKNELSKKQNKKNKYIEFMKEKIICVKEKKVNFF